MTQSAPEVKVCECCGAVIPQKDLRLAPTARKLYEFVGRHPRCTRDQIYEHLYYEREDGGPGEHVIYVMINQLNKKLVGHKIKASNRGWWATYSLVKDSPQ